MATATANLIWDSTTDANFRSWGSGIAALLLTGSFWQQTTDTGQINWTTVTAAAANTVAGYEIYKSVDALSSTFPIYMKVEYGSGNNVTKGALLKITFGSGSNGAGTLTGNVTSTFTHGPTNAGSGATTYPFYVSGGAGRFGMMLWNTSAFSVSGGFVIERALDSSGNYLDSYATYVIAFPSSTTEQRSIIKPSLGTFGGAGQANCFTMYWGSTSAANGTFAAVFPVFPFVGYADNPLTALMGMKSGDITEGGTFDVTLYGTSRHFLWSGRTNMTLGATVSLGFGMRYD